ncbi:uncharacterized protein E0L32_006495 [Thyridium curvatum]|uniref:Uncharacterized protein n=1 Tax=Thyridium curvatum TaxID=1093900 RepID=A0A507B6Q5_9PEZI|nr:uncharacterized protein E0L32_006495 [Thyridium curvatum]TPX13069.1 hypothetical protein E0L32_006495 [Thyridium curvatum]
MSSSSSMGLPRDLFVRDDGDAADQIPQCAGWGNADFDKGLRIASIFIILVASLLGAVLPVYLARGTSLRLPKTAFFIAKYFGSGVIIATAFMHLLSPANEALGDKCLSNILPSWDFAQGIALMTVMVMFFIELTVSRFDFGFGHAHSHDAVDPASDLLKEQGSQDIESSAVKGHDDANRVPGLENDVSYPPGGRDHLGHARDHVDGDSYAAYSAQLTALFILEFGVIFHSIFIGLTLSVSDNLHVLVIVLTFHQLFEGLGLGSRLATARWPADSRRFTPYLMGILYAISTPLAIAVGLGVREGLSSNPAHAQLTNGIFDAISAGILIYTGLVELMAHEFMFSPEMRKASFRMQMFAFGCMALGVALMALLAKWA